MVPPDKIYEMVPTMARLKEKILEYQGKINADPKVKKKMDLVYFQ